MKITWLGQAGFYLEINNTCIFIDPYLTNSIGENNPLKNRKVVVDKNYLNKKADVIAITHSHIDHLDFPTLDILLKNNNPLFLSPSSCNSDIKTYNKNTILFNCGTEWTQNDITFRAIRAVHSDCYAIGLLITYNNVNLYFTGDTLYSDSIFDSLGKTKINYLFLPINGTGNNMNHIDAQRFAEKLKAEKVFPMHYGMFDDINPEIFTCKNKVIMKEFKTFIL